MDAGRHRIPGGRCWLTWQAGVRPRSANLGNSRCRHHLMGRAGGHRTCGKVISVLWCVLERRLQGVLGGASARGSWLEKGAVALGSDNCVCRVAATE